MCYHDIMLKLTQLAYDIKFYNILLYITYKACQYIKRVHFLNALHKLHAIKIFITFGK